jgi:hypothetical protein
MEVFISIAGRQSDEDLGHLRNWLTSGGSALPWRLEPAPAASGDSLGLNVEEICAVVTAAGSLPPLVERVSQWFATRHEPPKIDLKMTLDPEVPPERPGHE